MTAKEMLDHDIENLAYFLQGAHDSASQAEFASIAEDIRRLQGLVPGVKPRPTADPVDYRNHLIPEFKER